MYISQYPVVTGIPQCPSKGKGGGGGGGTNALPHPTCIARYCEGGTVPSNNLFSKGQEGTLAQAS